MKKSDWLIVSLFLLLFAFPGIVLAVGADVNNDGIVNGADLILVLQRFGLTGTSQEDVSGDQKVNLVDAGHIVRDWGQGPQPTLPPTQPSEWTQFGHDAQRTSWTAEEIQTPWRYKWDWNAAKDNGETDPANHISAASFCDGEASFLTQPITGGGQIYVVAGNKAYAFDKNNGNEVWSRGSIGTLSGTPAYDQGYLYLPSENGNVYKLNAQTGGTVDTFSGSGSFKTPVLLVDDRIYAVNSSGILYAINKETMSKIWDYDGDSPGATCPSYSASHDLVVFATQNLNVHAVGENGTGKWTVKPTENNYTNRKIEFDYGWPVVADEHGIVLFRLRLPWNTVSGGPGESGRFPTTNGEIRSFLASNPDQQSLFALNLGDGSTAFIPAVGNGGQEDRECGGSPLVIYIAPPPVIAIIDGQEVAYTLWRNGERCEIESACDGRWDSTLGEMVLDSSTVSGYGPGDVRFILVDGIKHTDEYGILTGSGKTIFYGHWQANMAEKITNRGSGLGGSVHSPIQTSQAPYIVWSTCDCDGNCNPNLFPGGSGYSGCYTSGCGSLSSHYCSGRLNVYGDGRIYHSTAGGFYEYLNDRYHEGIGWWKVPFSVASDDLLIVKAPDGGLLVFEHGNP